MLALAGLAVIALVVVNLAVTERQSTFQSWLASAAFQSADSGGEAAINWLARQNRPPVIQDFADLSVKTAPTSNLHDTQRYDYGVRFVEQRWRPGWSSQFADFVYAVASNGAAGVNGNAAVALNVGKITVQGYQVN